MNENSIDESSKIESSKIEDKDLTENKSSRSFVWQRFSKKFYIAIIAAASAIVIAVCGFGIYVSGYERIMPNTYIEDVNLGGMTQQDAFSLLASQYSEDKLAGKTIDFSCMGDKSSIQVENLAMVFKPEQMASDAYSIGREKDGFFHKFGKFVSAVFSRNFIRPSLSYDEQALIGSIGDICSPHEQEPLGYTYRIGDGSNIIIAKPQDGIKVDMEEAVRLVEDEICTFRFGNIDFVPVKTKAPEFNLDEFYNYITQPACDASYAKDDNGSVYVVPGRPQIVVSKSDIESAVKQSELEYSVPVQLVNSAVDAAFLQSILYEDTLGSYSTNYGGSSAARASNIRTASNTINGYELLPGEEFDFNKIVGERKASTGYLQAPVYVVKNGKTESDMDYGGGICQVSSTIYCAVSRAKLKVVARTSHSKDVSYVPQGMDATVSWGGPEFIFKNNTEYPVRVLINASGGVLSASIVGSVVEKPDVKLEVQNDGNIVTVKRTVTAADGTQTSEIISSNTPSTPKPSIMPESVEATAVPTEGAATAYAQ